MLNPRVRFKLCSLPHLSHFFFFTETLTIGIKDQNDQVIHFKIKPTTKLEKVFKTYAERKGISLTACRFMIDGERVPEGATPKELEMKDQDEIECLLQQVGGF